MARFFFDLHESGSIAEDTIGSELPSAQAAYREAAIALGEIMKDKLGKSQDPHGIRITVRDEDGVVVCDASLSFDSHRHGIHRPQH
jgi:hypothetical protein